MGHFGHSRGTLWTFQKTSTMTLGTIACHMVGIRASRFHPIICQVKSFKTMLSLKLVEFRK